jgi:hypothetical protein
MELILFGGQNKLYSSENPDLQKLLKPKQSQGFGMGPFESF